MYRFGLLSCILCVFGSGYTALIDDDTLPDLKWPKKYTFDAEKLSLTNGLVEDIKYWKTKIKSRVDYNKGAVKTVSVKPRIFSRKFLFGVMYEVHPETTEEKENYLVCVRTNGTIDSRITLDEILPDESSFEHVGSENFDQDTVEKFSYTESDVETDIRQTLWAIYDRINGTWRPIRYEAIEYNTWLDYASKHEIWNFYNFATIFNSSSIFDFEDFYDCKDTENPPEVDKTRKNSIDPDNEEHVLQIFNSFKNKHNRIYQDIEEHSLRRTLFQKRMRLILENNRKKTGFKLAINKFADRTPEEIKKYMGLIRPNQRETDTHPFPYSKSKVEEIASTLPSDYDLRDLGVITPVKSQESCGSCWTFGTTSAMEGALARKNGGRLLRLSNQALLDCAWGYGLSGCNGGYDIGAYRWMIAHGLPTEEEYGPYANKDGFCHIKNMTTTYPIQGFTNVTPLSVEALKVAVVNHGPLSVSIHATDLLLLYNGGIYYDTECDPQQLNHEMTLVGYGQRDGEEFWIVKNSWGQNWGIDGYLYIAVRDNNCGVTTEPTYVVI